MDIGMLWYEADSKKSAIRIIQEAIEYYEKKYGGKVTSCELNKSVWSKDLKIDNVSIKLSKYMPLNHYLLGE